MRHLLRPSIARCCKNQPLLQAFQTPLALQPPLACLPCRSYQQQPELIAELRGVGGPLTAEQQQQRQQRASSTPDEAEREQLKQWLARQVQDGGWVPRLLPGLLSLSGQPAQQAQPGQQGEAAEEAEVVAGPDVIVVSDGEEEEAEVGGQPQAQGARQQQPDQHAAADPPDGNPTRLAAWRAQGRQVQLSSKGPYSSAQGFCNVNLCGGGKFKIDRCGVMVSKFSDRPQAAVAGDVALLWQLEAREERLGPRLAPFFNFERARCGADCSGCERALPDVAGPAKLLHILLWTWLATVQAGAVRVFQVALLEA